MTIRQEMIIDCPPTTAFDLMADVTKLTEWNEGASSAEKLSSGPIQEGTRFIAFNRGQEMQSTITRFERPELLEFSVTGKALDVDAVFRFSEAGDGSELRIEFDTHPKGVIKALFPVLKPMIRRDLAKQHLKFKAYCESKVRSHNG